MLDTECREQPRQGPVLARRDRRNKLLGGHLREPLETQQLFRSERVDVCGVRDQTRVGQQEHGALTESLDIHRTATCEVDDPLVALERTARLDAPCV